ncbi:MAG: hypothetical protein ACJA1E_000601 [Paracoccaceae bacterium]|jgi:hypothetical protein
MTAEKTAVLVQAGQNRRGYIILLSATDVCVPGLAATSHGSKEWRAVIGPHDRKVGKVRSECGLQVPLAVRKAMARQIAHA